MIELQKFGLLDKLLVDKTTKGHILWGTDAYAERGESYAKGREIFVSLVLYNNLGVIKTRARKAFEQQLDRTKLHGEVFTPRWVCNMMIDAIDSDWFGIDKLPVDAWQHVEELFQQTKKSWKKYVDNKRLEITCGEAPYLVQRYDVANGEMMPVKERIGILDRKLHVVSTYTTTVDEWIHWSIRAFEATFGYEYQGDNLLIARVNFMKTFIEFYQQKWNGYPDSKVLEQLIHKITWNVWQMDGLTDTIPCSYNFTKEQSLFDIPQDKIENQPVCKLRSWRGHNISSFSFKKMKGRQTGMKFDYIIGNPPYQRESSLNGRQPPIYHLFMDEAYKAGKVVELITPARFLFDAGQTPKAWNHKMLQDEHFKVLHYESKGKNIFPSTDIKGGVAITIHNENKKFGEIGVFTPYECLNTLLRKVKSLAEPTLDSVIGSRGLYRFTSAVGIDYPDLLKRVGEGTGNMIVSNAFEKMPEIFLEHIPEQSGDTGDKFIYYMFLGRLNNKRVYRFISSKYVIGNEYIHTYNVLIPKSNGTGRFGEALSSPEIASPAEGATDTFISIGKLKSQDEATALVRYIKTKFFRALLSAKKVTQDNPKSTWALIPLQDFTVTSSIDWTKSIEDIDEQLYIKYGLSQQEIDFIETNVKEMK